MTASNTDKQETWYIEKEGGWFYIMGPTGETVALTKSEAIADRIIADHAEAAAGRAALHRIKEICDEERGLSVSGAVMDQIEGIVNAAIDAANKE